MKKIIIHAGTPKTGSTSIQESLKLSYFDDNFDKYIFFGDFYCKKDNFRTADIFIKFFKRDLTDLKFDYLPKKNTLKQIIDNELQKFSKSKYQQAIISSEFFYILNHTELDDLQEYLKKFDIIISKIIFFIRNPIEQQISRYQNYILSGGTSNQKEFVLNAIRNSNFFGRLKKINCITTYNNPKTDIFVFNKNINIVKKFYEIIESITPKKKIDYNVSYLSELYLEYIRINYNIKVFSKIYFNIFIIFYSLVIYLILDFKSYLKINKRAYIKESKEKFIKIFNQSIADIIPSIKIKDNQIKNKIDLSTNSDFVNFISEYKIRLSNLSYYFNPLGIDNSKYEILNFYKKDDINLKIINDLMNKNLIFKLRLLLYCSKKFYLSIKKSFNIK
jgi:hypothetical protein